MIAQQGRDLPSIRLTLVLFPAPKMLRLIPEHSQVWHKHSHPIFIGQKKKELSGSENKPPDLIFNLRKTGLHVTCFRAFLAILALNSSPTQGGQRELRSPLRCVGTVITSTVFLVSLDLISCVTKVLTLTLA